MKFLLGVTVAVFLGGTSLWAQDQAVPGGNAPAQSDQASQEALIQQALKLSTQALAEEQRQSPADAGAHGSDDAAKQSSVVQQLLRLALQEVSLIQRQLNQDDMAGPGAPSSAAQAATDPAAARAPSGGEDAMFAAFAHAWDTSLSTGGLRTGSLQTGDLRTGSLQTGKLQSGGFPANHAAASAEPAPEAISSPVNSIASAAASGAVPVPPGDPDDEMRRWSRQIDRQYPSEQVARTAAIKLYPDLARSQSAFNTQYLARYSQYRQADPFGFLRGPGWPMKLAIFTAGDLQRQKSGSAMLP